MGPSKCHDLSDVSCSGLEGGRRVIEWDTSKLRLLTVFNHSWILSKGPFSHNVAFVLTMKQPHRTTTLYIQKQQHTGSPTGVIHK